MFARGRSKERNSTRKVTPPSPSYMSNEQFGMQGQRPNVLEGSPKLWLGPVVDIFSQPRISQTYARTVSIGPQVLVPRPAPSMMLLAYLSLAGHPSEPRRLRYRRCLNTTTISGHNQTPAVFPPPLAAHRLLPAPRPDTQPRHREGTTTRTSR